MAIPDNLKTLVDLLPARLKSIPSEKASRKPAPNKWSPKEELGHLLDSAVMNHARFVRVQLEHEPTLNGYDGDAWVAVHRYQDWEWETVIDTWHKLNLHLLTAVEKNGRPCLAASLHESRWTRSHITVPIRRLCSPCSGAPAAHRRRNFRPRSQTCSLLI